MEKTILINDKKKPFIPKNIICYRISRMTQKKKFKKVIIF